MPFSLRTTASRTAVAAVLTAFVASGMASADAALPKSITPVTDGSGQTTLSPKLLASAAAYARYMERAGQISPDFQDGPGVGKAVVEGASYEPTQLQEGVIAYVAIAALQNPRFVRTVQKLDRGQQDELADRLLADPSAAMLLPGAGDAAQAASDALRQQGGQVYAAGRAVKQAAYDVQHQAWSKSFVPDRPGRLARAKAVSAVRYTPGPADALRLANSTAALRDQAGSGGQDGAAPSPLVQRGLALAAMAAMGRAGDADAAAVAPLLKEPRNADCLKMAKLNLFQCLAVAGPYYEDVFCLGQHALMDTGKCVSDAAGASAPRPRAALDGVASRLASATPVSSPVPIRP